MAERSHKNIESFSQIKNNTEEIQQYSGIVSNFCFQKIEENYFKGLEIYKYNDNEVEYTLFYNDDQVKLEKNFNCFCHFYQSCGIPCMHILALKHLKNENVFHRELVNERFVYFKKILNYNLI